jgi:hypothetical protein
MSRHVYIYGVLQQLYPVRFRSRFGREMLQVFSDCYDGSARTWLVTLKDLAVSIPREWRRELTAEDSAIDFTGIMDAIVVSIVVGSNLIGWGWLAAAFTLRLTTVSDLLNPDFGSTSWYTIAMILMVVVTIAMAALIGMLSALIVGRIGRPQGTRIKV